MYIVKVQNQIEDAKNIIIQHQIPHIIIYHEVRFGISLEIRMYICIEEVHAPFAILCGLNLNEYNCKDKVIMKHNELFALELK